MSDALPCDPSETTCTVCGAEPYAGCKNKAFLGSFAPHPAMASIADAKDINPKDIVGGPKFSISALPVAGLAQLEAPFRDGAEKYGPANWRDQPVSARVYLDASFRHMALFMAGQDVTSDTGVCHLAAAASNLLILLDARAGGTMKDDRVRMADPDVLEEIFQEIRERNGG